MKILGINLSHDASSCLLDNGNLIYYIEEERYSKIKHHTINYSNPKFYGIEKLKEYKIDYVDYIVFSFVRFSHDVVDEIVIENVTKQIENAGIKYKSIIFDKENHHLYHAYNALYHSKFNEAGCLIIDSSGAYTDKFYDFREIESIYHFKDNNVMPIYKHLSSQFYNEGHLPYYELINNNNIEILLSNMFSSAKLFDEYCLKSGFKTGHDSGKLMGLSSYGKIKNNNKWFDIIDKNVIYNKIVLNDLENHNGLKADIAKKLQEQTKNHTIKLIEKTINKTQSNNIVLSGGYFLNCVNNYEYLKKFPNINFYIDPICYDGGTAIGASIYAQKLLNKELPFFASQNLFLG